MRAAVAAVWAVVLCAFFVQAGNGLQADLIGLQANAAFSAMLIGLLMAAYYVGFSLAPVAGRFVIGRLGHPVAVAICVAAAAAVILAMPLSVNAPAWAGYRLISGFALSMSYVAVESWINDAVPNEMRGRVFSIYMFAQMVGMTLAQVLFSIGGASGYVPFVMAALLLVLAAVPVLALRFAAPRGVPPEPLGIVALFRMAPAGALITMLSGVSWSILFAFGPVYAHRIGLSASGVGLFMGLAVAAGGLVQIPAGWLSDVIGRRPVLGIVFAAGLAASLFGLVAPGDVQNIIAAALVGGFVFPIYAVAAAMVNDAVSNETRVAAAAGLVLLFGLGSIVGPLLCGWAMEAFGRLGFCGLIALSMAAGLIVVVAVRPKT